MHTFAMWNPQTKPTPMLCLTMFPCLLYTGNLDNLDSPNILWYEILFNAIFVSF